MGHPSVCGWLGALDPTHRIMRDAWGERCGWLAGVN